MGDVHRRRHHHDSNHNHHHQQQAPYDADGASNNERYLDDEQNNKLVQRVFSYSLVDYASSSLLFLYDQAKQSNYLVKAGIETAESYSLPILHKLSTYSHQPTIENLLHKVDQYGCRQLDKIENGGKQIKDTYNVIKPKTIQSLETVANKIHGTPVETALFKTVDVVDVVVDSLLPPDPAEPITVNLVVDPNVIDKTAPVITKLRNRVNPHSIARLPVQTYTVTKDIIFRNADAIPQLHYCIGVLSTAAHRVRDVSANTRAVAKTSIQKGATASKASVDYVYNSLTTMVQHLTSIVVLVKKLDPTEARATVEELTLMIQHSKEELSQKYGRDTAARLKEDISRILQKAGDLLSQQVAAGYTRVHSTDNAAIRKSVETIEGIVLRIVENFSNQQDNVQEQDPQPSQSQ